MPFKPDLTLPQLQVSDEHYLAIGKVIVHWAILEQGIDKYVRLMRYHPAATQFSQERARNEFKQRITLWKRLAGAVYANDAQRLKALNHIIDRVSAARVDRDWVAHAAHTYDGDDPEKKLRATLMPKGAYDKPFWVKRRYHNPPRLDELAERIFKIYLDLSRFEFSETLGRSLEPPLE
jgi:hypothetical protein